MCLYETVFISDYSGFNKALNGSQTWCGISWSSCHYSNGAVACLGKVTVVTVTVRCGKWKETSTGKCYTALFNNGTLWFDHKTFTKYTQSDAVSYQYMYFLYIYLYICIYLSSNKNFILITHGSKAAFSAVYRAIFNVTYYIIPIYIYKCLQTSEGMNRE